MFAIQDKSRNGTYLKFITDAFPLGLWTGDASARSFKTEEDANKQLDELRTAVIEDAWGRVGQVLKSDWSQKYKVEKTLSMLNEAGLDCECYTVVPHPTKGDNK